MNVFTVSKVLLMYVVESQMILNGNAGQVYAASPFLPSLEHPFDVYSLVAFSTANKLYIMSLYQASVQMHCNVERTGSAAVIPCLSWLCTGATQKRGAYACAWLHRSRTCPCHFLGGFSAVVSSGRESEQAA